MPPSSESTPSNQKPYKWLHHELATSDPYKDYAKIWRLPIEYTAGGNLMQNLIYATTFSNFIATPWGSEAVRRGDGGKVIHAATSRSVHAIDKRHEHYAALYPGHFAHTEDFTYVLCFTAISVHRLRTRLGLAGFSEKQKIAAHLFWREMGRLFFVEVPGKPLDEWIPMTSHPDAKFPSDWDSMVSFCQGIEDHGLQVTEKGHYIAEARFDQFAYRFFLRGLRGLGRALPVALSLPQALREHQIEPVNPVLVRVVLFVVESFIWFAEVFLPDPKEGDEGLDKGFPAVFAEDHAGQAGACQFAVEGEKAE
ncbi:hypothetical protein BDW74DRAFT_177995 [Aspergillus multicolor]|uniref:uncharacterized protein n=1 Tax=Aspergillus multicolor TaxID=41759 RepID=UPI003CCD1CAA